MKRMPLLIGVVLTLILLPSLNLFGSDLIHVVKKGETLYRIARMYGVSVEAIEKANDITVATDLRVGTSLKIPGTYTVKRGDTLYGIAKDHGMSLTTLLSLNHIDTAHVIHAGDILLIPGAEQDTVDVAQQVAAGQESGNNTTSAMHDTATTQSVSMTSSTPFWPHSGQRDLLSGKLSGGVQIDGKEGDPVVSVSNGRVVWVGPYRGYGQVVFVESADHYIYVYGGNDQTDVRVGQQVTPGAEVAEMGINPHLGRACIYFFVYKDGKPVDPQDAPRG